MLVISAISLYVCGCSVFNNGMAIKTSEGGKVKMKIEETNKDAYATKEWVYETFSLTDKDFEGIDLDVVFETYPTEKKTIVNIKQENIVTHMTYFYKLALEKKEAMKYDKKYLVEAEDNDSVCPSFDNIKFLAFSVARGDGNGSYLIDFEHTVMYFSYAYPVAYENYSKADITIELSEDDISVIKEALKRYGIANWNYFYDGTSEVYEGFGWNIGMEFTDGTIISKSGSGEAATVIPNNFVKFEDSIDGIRMKYEK